MGALPASRRIALARLAGKVPSLGGSLSSKGLGRNGGRSREVRTLECPPGWLDDPVTQGCQAETMRMAKGTHRRAATGARCG
jgi:hypothetical protein